MKRSFTLVCSLCLLGATACKTSSSRSSSDKSPVAIQPGEQVAVVDGNPLTYGEVAQQSGGKLKQAEVKALSDLYEARRGAIDEMVTKRLLEEEAKTKGKTVEQWY